MKQTKNLSRKLIFFLISVLLVILLCYPAAGAQDTRLNDISGTPFYDPVTQLESAEIITGYPDGSFRPYQTLSRAEAVTMVYRAYGHSDLALASPWHFRDVASGMWAASFITYCAGAGIINGYPDGTFRPDSQVTYNEIITLMIRARGLDDGSLSWPEGYIRAASADGMLNDLYQVNLPEEGNAPASRGNTAALIASGSEYNEKASDGPTPDLLADPDMACQCYGLLSESPNAARGWGRLLMGPTTYDLPASDRAPGLLNGYNPAFGLIRILMDNGRAVSAEKVTGAWSADTASGLLTPASSDRNLTEFCRVTAAGDQSVSYRVSPLEGGTILYNHTVVCYEISLKNGAPAASAVPASDIRPGDMAAVYNVTGNASADIILIVHPESAPDILHASDNENVMYMG